MSMNMKDFIAVTDNHTDGFLGYLLYYSISGVLVPRDKLIKVGEDMGLTKVKPARESKSNAYRKATTAIKDRIVHKTPHSITTVSFLTKEVLPKLN